MQPKLTEQQEAKLEQALEIAQNFEQKVKELSDLGDAFAQKWKRRLHNQQIAKP